MTWTRDDYGVWRMARRAAWKTYRGWRWVCYTADGRAWRSGTERTLSEARKAAEAA